jgi:tetratricopeptide (TPR) repeat protein
MDAAAGPLVLARHDLDRGRPDRALDALTRATGDELETYDFWSIRSRALYELRRWDDATEAAQTGLKLSPDDFLLLDVLALAQLERGQKKAARATIEHALERYPDQAVLHAHRALILARSGRRPWRRAALAKARVAVDEALRLDPQSEAAIRVRAQIAMLSRDGYARNYSNELLSLDPEDEHAHVIAGSALVRGGDVDAGLRHYVEAARLDPVDPRMAWLGRRSRILQGPLAAPLRHASRITRGRLRFYWIFVVILTLGLHQPVLTWIVFAFWVYMWAMTIYVRARAGKRPK